MDWKKSSSVIIESMRVSHIFTGNDEMAKIIINDLSSGDLDSYLTEVNELDSLSIYGGESEFQQILNFAYNLLNFVLSAYAIYNISSIAKSFKITRNKTTRSVFSLF
ncbi:hypothetical protein [Nostoc cycadae]|nr:hypothetical protein [Nostoc cycadae]